MALGKNISKDKLIPTKLKEEEIVVKETKNEISKLKMKRGSKNKKKKNELTAKSSVKKKTKPIAKTSSKVEAKKMPKEVTSEAVKTELASEQPAIELSKENVEDLVIEQTQIKAPAQTDIPISPIIHRVAIPKFLTKEEIAVKKELKAKHDEEIKNLRGKNVQLIVFRLGADRYALEIDNVKKIVAAPKMSKLPHAPEYVKGVANIRGYVMVILDLEEKFELFKSTELSDRTKDYTLVIKNERFKIGLLINEVPTTLKVLGDVIESSSGIMSNTVLDETFIKGLIKQKEDMIILLDIIELIESKEVRIIAQTVGDKN